jgi:hypothetical protein
MVFEASRHQRAAIGEKGGGKRIAGKPGEGLAIEGEAKRPRAID